MILLCCLLSSAPIPHFVLLLLPCQHVSRMDWLMCLLCKQVSSISSDVQQSVGSAVQAALSETLPQELAGPQLRATLEASLGSQLQRSLAQPLQDSFTSAFQHQLMPAFEGACRDMFAQVSSFVMHQTSSCDVISCLVYDHRFHRYVFPTRLTWLHRSLPNFEHVDPSISRLMA